MSAYGLVRNKMRNKYDVSHVMYRDGVYYYVRRIPCDLASFYSVKRLCFSLKIKSLAVTFKMYLLCMPLHEPSLVMDE